MEKKKNSSNEKVVSDLRAYCNVIHRTQYKTINIDFGPLSGRPPDEMYLLIYCNSAAHSHLNKKKKKITQHKRRWLTVNGFLGNTNAHDIYLLHVIDTCPNQMH